ncbi:hypothetical protein VNO77_45169 [Canavalia gladiata]|uniref:Uncharacterized protein n=1 Tax=Canavalia gladiata TaxID=3824 RepID=A0AAN9JTY7_CANGL
MMCFHGISWTIVIHYSINWKLSASSKAFCFFPCIRSLCGEGLDQDTSQKDRDHRENWDLGMSHEDINRVALCQFCIQL